MNRMTLPVVLVCSLGIGACTTEQAYNSLKGWQRNECNHRLDNREREQCLKDADQRYDEYRKETSP